MSIRRRISGVIRALAGDSVNSGDNVCAERSLSFPALAVSEESPAIDGDVENDPGWNNAVRLNLSGDIGATTAAKLQAGVSGSSLYLGLDVSAPGITTDTTLVLVFSGDGNPANDWRLHIRPFDVALPADGTKNLPPFRRDLLAGLHCRQQSKQLESSRRHSAHGRRRTVGSRPTSKSSK